MIFKDVRQVECKKAPAHFQEYDERSDFLKGGNAVRGYPSGPPPQIKQGIGDLTSQIVTAYKVFCFYCTSPNT
jgi:hypothetical protein